MVRILDNLYVAVYHYSVNLLMNYCSVYELSTKWYELVLIHSISVMDGVH